MRKGRRVLNGLLLLLMLVILSACGVTTEDVKTRMEKHLYEKYGEEFVVDRIGQRSANGQKFYQARIYPKSIIGTNREGDSYYYASASIDIEFGSKLAKEVGDSYDIVQFNEGIENYIRPKAKEIFGDRVRIKSDSKYKKNKNGTFYWAFQHDFLKAKEIVKTDKNYRIEFGVYIYIFDRIDSEEEKELRKEETYEFLKYLRKEKLDEYLKVFLVFTDEIVLAPSFEKYEWDLNNIEKDRLKIEKELRKEIKTVDVTVLINNMNNIMKSDMKVNRSGRFNKLNQADYFIITMEMLKIDKYGRYDEAKSNNTLENHYYRTKEDIEYTDYEDYILGGNNI